MMEFYVVLRSVERYYSEYKEYPGDLDDHVEPDVIKLKVIKLISLKISLHNTKLLEYLL